MKIYTLLKTMLMTTTLAIAIPFTLHAEPADNFHCKHPPAMIFNGKHFEHGAPPLAGIPPHLAILDLTETQKDKVFNLIYLQIPQMRDHEKLMHQLIKNLHNLANSEPFDEVKVRQVTEKIANLEKEAAFNRTRTDSQIFALLTPEQRKKLTETTPMNQDNFHTNSFPNKMHHKNEHGRLSKG